MRQKWRSLLFLHWEWDPGLIQATLPAGLEVDSHEGKAYLGVVPFFMCGVRPVFCPPVPGISNFLELNLRTYVRDRNGCPGVWFYSLDCNQFLAVKVARAFFHLPYEHAEMRAILDEDGSVRQYRCKRQTPGGGNLEGVFSYGPSTVSHCPAESGSLEEFLVERYRLFSYGRGGLWEGDVVHAPYRICPARVDAWSSLPILQAGFAMPDPARPPDHALFSAGVDVRILPLRRNRSARERKN